MLLQTQRCEDLVAPEELSDARERDDCVSGRGGVYRSVLRPLPPTDANASSSVCVEDTSETDPAGGAASTSPSAAKNSVKCGVWKWAYRPSRLAHSSTKMNVLGVSIAS
jgi:hypothetical protein